MIILYDPLTTEHSYDLTTLMEKTTKFSSTFRPKDILQRVINFIEVIKRRIQVYDTLDCDTSGLFCIDIECNKIIKFTYSLPKIVT